MVPSTTDLSMGALTQIDVTDVLGMLHYGLGGSTYDKHRDGTGVCHVSPLRPHVNVRPSQARVWNLFIDLCLIDWLEAEGFDYDVITDHDLHKDGAALLDGYAAVMTGCHPEYWSAAMLDATEEWLGRGGRFMYLGGNGLYWRISFPDSHPGMIEVRRAEGGTRAWAEQVGETHHASTGEHGGLWRHSGRAPNLIAGVGFVAQGFDSASFYRRTAASRDPRASWIFEGVEGETIGDFGVALGGAAGMEIDASNVALGTPAHALVVAASEGHTRSMNYVLEEMNAGFTGPHGQSWPAVRAELVFFETPSGGAVFSTGSISWLGSLGHAGRRNPVARLTGNVLRRFIDPAPFAMPGGGRK
jgi:N,N-dimethylformamidase